MQKKSVFNDQVKYLVYGSVIACFLMAAVSFVPFAGLAFTAAGMLFVALILLTGQMYLHSRKLAVRKTR